ncbi:MAG: hypothetical protein KGZ82_03240 [Bacteroidales bacterium]|nr:hypothetical protein [Bacteroidales bacterium]
MKKIRILSITFESKLNRSDISAFRGAIIGKVRKDSILYHNHLQNGFRYAYPLIQYKTDGERPMILCINDGVDEIQELFTHENWKELQLGSKDLNLNEYRVKVHEHNVQLWSDDFQYTIYNWMALNQVNYPRYAILQTNNEQIEFLEKILISNIISFAKGIDWHVDSTIRLHISAISKIRETPFKGARLRTFDVRFSTNVSLPDKIGLGKGASTGYGMIRKMKEE